MPRKFGSAAPLDLTRLQKASQYAVVLVDGDGIVTAWSNAACTVFGWSADEMIGRTFALLFLQGDREAGLPALELSDARERGCCDDARWLLRKDGSRFWASGMVLSLADGYPCSFIKVVRDRTQEKNAQEAIRASEAQHRLITESVPQLVWRSRIDGHWDWASPQWTSYTGQSQAGSLGHGWLEMVHPEDRDETERVWSSATSQGMEFEVEHRLRRHNGGYFWFKTRAVPLREAAGERPALLHWFGTSTDIHAAREAQDRILFLAHHDALTGAANRILLQETLERQLPAARSGRELGVFYIDLDRFKECNDRIGYSGGDAVLRQIAERLRSSLPETALLARVGGDEFVVLQDGANASELERVAQTLTRSVEGPLHVDEHVFHLGASVGVAVCPGDGSNADELIRRATVSLARAKADGGNRAYRFNNAMDEAARARRVLIGDLDDAIENGGLHLHYQPFFSLADGRLRGFEALARWNHPRRGTVSPSEFIPLAETSGRVDRLGIWALNRACAAAQSWLEPCAIAVNLSAAQFRGEGLTGHIAAALERTGLAPERLELEVTESLLIEDTESVLRKLRAIRELGLRIALDDFGTGYSSLSYLRRFPFDKVKIDRSFVQGMSEDKAAAAIVAAIVSLGHSLDLTITAEGVETEHQLELLRRAGCDEAQGYLLGIPREQTEAIIRRDYAWIASTSPRTKSSGSGS
ncbi:putative bifunctional diguanylate cyclase/phosphodiesterase [Lichenicoccus sp.]|uniref:putative bifunctional diguanylate cyclase/phosphodiesterase n=1 Tax=Lichenicoccus sp. TaxID=2781899 RepID=UPI003D0D1F3B